MTPLHLRHVRIQHPVGQGFFHSSMIEFEGADPFHIVYDCGSSAGAAARDEAIDNYREELRSSGFAVDALFISHAHEDHINGLPRLLGKNTAESLSARVVILPYLDAIARLIALGPSLDSSEGTFIEEFTVLGAGALTAQLNVERVIEIYPGDDLPDLDEEGIDVDSPTSERFDGARLEFDEQETSGFSARRSTFRSDHESLFLSLRGSRVWELRTFTDPKVLHDRDLFIARLERFLEGVYPVGESVEVWIQNSENMREVLRNHRAKLAKAYGATTERNATSLSLYSGPVGLVDVFARHCTYSAGIANALRWELLESDQLGWLGTGDATLKENFANFERHFNDVLDKVITLAVPHHGSRDNSDDRLFNRVRPGFAVIACSPNGGYGHPHSETVHHIANSGAQLIVVNEEKSTEFIEEILLSVYL